MRGEYSDCEVAQGVIIRYFTNHRNQQFSSLMLSLIADEHPITVKAFRESLVPEEQLLGKNVPKAVLLYKSKVVDVACSDINKAIIEALQSEECYTYQFDYSSSHKVLVDLHAKMRSICDELGVSITNIVEDIKQYNVVYFLKTTGKYSYIKFFFDKNMFVTYGHPYSDIEAEDVLLNEIIAKLS
jgi:hypothetical protein